MKSVTFLMSISLASALTAVGLEAHAAEYEQISGGPVQAFTQKSGDASYTIFKFSLSGANYNSTSKVFANGSTFVSECIGYSKSEKGVSSVESHCTSTDNDGTVTHGSTQRVGAMGQPTTGKELVEVQNGANAGVTSECSFTPKYAKGSDGTFLIVNAKCTTAK